MNDLQMMQEKSVLRWGGLAGILGGLLLIVVFVVVGVFVGANPAEPEVFPDIRAARTVENSLYLAVLVLWVIHFLALYRALHRTSLAPALFGSAMGVLGLGVVAAGAIPHIVTARISDLYQAPGATAEDQANLVLVFEATHAVFEALLITGLAILPACLVVLGVAMAGSPAFGKRFGAVSAALGVAGGVAVGVTVIDPASSPLLAICMFSLMIFHLVLGWKLYRLSRNPASILEDRGYTGNGVRAESDFSSTEPINVVRQSRETP